MLAVLVAEDLVVISTNHPLLQPAPVREVVHRLELAPGIWIVREKQWLHASVFDTHETLPLHVEIDEIPKRNLPYPQWHQWALCAGMPTEAFFGGDSDDRPTMKRSELSDARRTCAACEVKFDCLSWALNPGTQEKHGVWGGTSGRQRAQMRKKLATQGAPAVINEWFELWLGQTTT